MQNELAALYLRSAVANDSAIEEHRKNCEDYAHTRDWKVACTFVDNGRSGMDDRPGLFELRRCIAERGISIVLTPKQAHIAREPKLYKEFFALCSTHNVKIVFAETDSVDSLSSREQIRSAMDQLFKQNLKGKNRTAS